MNYEDPNYNVGLPVFMIHGAWSPEPGVSAFPRSENRSRNEGGGVPTTGAENGDARFREPRTEARDPGRD